MPATDSAGNPFYGVTTDATGNFLLSGDYTCDVGSPVYIIGYGGSPSYPSGADTFNISSVTSTGTAPNITYTFTISNPPENAYIGESATITGLTGVGTFTNAGTGVLATGLTTTTFALTSTTGGDFTNVAQTGASVTFSPTFNPSAVNIAVLGNCPSTGVANFGSTSTNPVKYVYMNEVSTTAAAYALAGFVDPTKTSQTGLDEFHIGTSGSTQAVLGIQNATLTAANLYDITGSNITTSYAGEGHIARTTTVGSNATTVATVPQALIDTIGNILAACVDSNNTYVITSASGVSPATTSGVLSSQCQTLFQYATDNGVHDTTTFNATLTATAHQPYNIAQAAFSMARIPQGAGVGSTNSSGVQTISSAMSAANATAYVAALYALPTGNPPFTPNLVSTSAGAPNSFAIPITYSNSTMLTPYRDAIDSTGNVWVIGNNQTYALKFNNLGVQQYALTGVDGGTSVAIDQNDNAWVTSVTNSTVQEFSSTGATLQAGLAPTGINQPYAIAIDGSNNPWVGNESGTSLIKLTNAGATTASFSNASISTVEGMAFDTTGAVWLGQFTGTAVSKINATDTALSFANPTGNGLNVTARVVVDSSNNAWFESSGNATIEELSSTGAFLSGTTGFSVPGGNGTNPEGLGIDGNDNIWACFAGTSAATSGVAKFNHATGAYLMNITTNANGSRGCQIDPSGNLWVVENQASPALLVEFVGIATPVVTPTSTGVKNSKLGTKP